MLTGAVEHWIGNAAAVLSGAWGAVTRRAEHSGYSRTTLYTHAERVVQAVGSEHARGLSYEALWAQHEQLQAENAALWQAWEEAETLSESTQRQLASAGSAMGLSLTQIVAMLAIVLPMAVVPSRATVGRWVQESAAQSSRLLKVLDRVCQRWVLTVCLDEIFFHRAPILMAVEPVSLVWLAGQRGPDRSGASWCEVIEQWPSLAHIIADGGTGLANGVKWANERRRVQAQERGVEPGPAMTMGLDVFHSQREMERVLQRQWKQVEHQLEEASEADVKVAQYKRRGRDARGVAGSASRAWRKAERLFDEAVHVEEAVRQLKTALVWFDADGQLLSRGAAQQQLEKASEMLSGSPWSKVRRLLQDERTLSHLDRLEKQLAETVAEPQLRETLTRLWALSQRRKHAEDDEVGRWGAVVTMAHVLCSRLCPQWQEVSMQVDALLRQAVRASSAVEGVNSVVRMHQGRHRHVSQGMLDLKRLYWNCRVFREGKRKGSRPYDLLGLPLPTSDWWQLLQMDPEELEQNLLTQELAA